MDRKRHISLCATDCIFGEREEKVAEIPQSQRSIGEERRLACRHDAVRLNMLGIKRILCLSAVPTRLVSAIEKTVYSSCAFGSASLAKVAAVSVQNGSRVLFCVYNIVQIHFFFFKRQNKTQHGLRACCQPVRIGFKAVWGTYGHLPWPCFPYPQIAENTGGIPPNDYCPKLKLKRKKTT